MATATAARRRKPRGRLTRAQQDLAEQYLPMARRIARPMKKSYPCDWEEFESAACLALVQAAESFDPRRHVKFSTFARLRIWGALQDVRRKHATRAFGTPERPIPSHFADAPYDEEQHGRVLLCPDSDPIGDDLDAIEAVELWIKKLPKGHQAACRQIYTHGKTHAQAAKALGLSPSRVTYIHLEAMAILNGTWDGKRPKANPRARSN
jgi:RNA polymerase sigma factor (sigma-70 family)